MGSLLLANIRIFIFEKKLVTCCNFYILQKHANIVRIGCDGSFAR